MHICPSVLTECNFTGRGRGVLLEYSIMYITVHVT